MEGKLEHGGRAIGWLVLAQRIVCVLLVVVLLVLIMTQAVSRYVFDMPLRWTEEVARFVFIWMAFVGGGFVMGEGRHIAVDIIGRAVGRRGRVAVELLATIVAVVVAGVIIVAAVPYVSRMMNIGSAAVGIPRGLWIVAVPVGLGLMGLHAVVNAVVAVRRGEPIWAHNIGAESEVDDIEELAQSASEIDEESDGDGSGGADAGGKA